MTPSPGPAAAPLRAVRSTLLVSSRAALRESGRFDDYERCLDAATRSRLEQVIAGTWLETPLAIAHYAACDALALPRQEQSAMGKRTGERLSGTLLGTLAKLARSTGTTPMTLIEQFPRFWTRGFEGGAVRHVRRGPKEVDVFIEAEPLARSAYFRNGLGGTCESMLALVASKVYLRVKEHAEQTGTIVYLLQWA